MNDVLVDSFYTKGVLIKNRKGFHLKINVYLKVITDKNKQQLCKTASQCRDELNIKISDIKPCVEGLYSGSVLCYGTDTIN